MNWSMELGEDTVTYQLDTEAFARIDRKIFMENLLNPDKAKVELEELANYESLHVIIDKEVKANFPEVKCYYKLQTNKKKY